MDLRAYARAKETYDTTEMDKRPKNKMMDLVSEFVMGKAKKRIQEARDRGEIE